MLFKKWMCSSLLVLSQVMAFSYAQADIAYAPGISGGVGGGVSAGIGLTGQLSYGLAGSGYWGGTQACPYKTKTSKAAYDESDDIKAEKKEIEKIKKEVELKKLEVKRADGKLEILSKKIEKFFETEVAEFLTSTHMSVGGMNLCSDYRTFPEYNCPVPGKPGTTNEPGDAQGQPVSKDTVTKCNGKTEVPPLLKDTWTKSDGTGYCAANSNSSRGLISSSICSDNSLRPSDIPKSRKISTTDCSRTLSEYRKARIEYDKAQDLVDRKTDEADERTSAIASKQEMEKLERDYKMKTQLEGKSECEDCKKNGGYERPQRDWWSTAANVVGGLGLAWYGKKIDESAQEYNAQLGYPSTNSYGYPFVTAGVYSVINGLAGPGAYGCAGGIGGSGFPYGGAGAGGPYGANGYGPFAAQGGAFGYPSNLYGSPWGGGMYQPGIGVNGALNGPNGGWPYGLTGQFGVGSPISGQIGVPATAGWQNGGWQQNQVMCITWPCNTVGNAIAGASNGQIGIPASGGWPASGNMNSGYMTNYQLQMMQQQQAMLQAQAQQQAQLAQYYQAQAQQQMQAYQRQQMVQQQAMQVQQEISSLQMRLQMLVSGAYSGSSYGAGGLYGGGSLGTGGYLGGGFGGIVSGGIYFGAAATSYSTGYNGLSLPSVGTAATLPGVGSATTTRGR